MSDLNLKTVRVINGREITISTIELPVKHYGDMWYETMIFPSKDGKIISWSELYSSRYRTEEAAIEGHNALVKMSENELAKELSA